jgi:type III secretory pathway lipoprotein EscJ
MLSTVELMRDADGPELITALSERGLKADLVDHDDGIAVQVEDCDEEQLTHAIEDWIRARELPLVPVRIDDCTYAVAPPAA